MNSSLVYLVQTDTTVGFSSANDEKLANIKQRPISKKILQTIDSFNMLKKNTRIPTKHKKFIRKSKNTTFIYPNKKSFRVISKDSSYYDFIKKFKFLYSSSANLSGNLFDENFAIENSDVLVETKDGFLETASSSIYKINRKKITKIR